MSPVAFTLVFFMTRQHQASSLARVEDFNHMAEHYVYSTRNGHLGELIKGCQISKYFATSCVALVFYDLLLNFDQEVSQITVYLSIYLTTARLIFLCRF